MISNDGNNSTEIPVGFLSRADCYKHGLFYRSVLDNVPHHGTETVLSAQWTSRGDGFVEGLEHKQPFY